MFESCIFLLQLDLLQDRLKEKDKLIEAKVRQVSSVQSEKKQLEQDIHELHDHLDIKDRKTAVLSRKVRQCMFVTLLYNIPEIHDTSCVALFAALFSEIFVKYFWFKYNIDRSTMHPKFDLARFKLMTSRSWAVYFMSLRRRRLNHSAIRDHLHSQSSTILRTLYPRLREEPLSICHTVMYTPKLPVISHLVHSP